MTKQNRPYSLINIFDNLHAAIKKPLLEKILDDLCEESKLRMKDFNKNKDLYAGPGKIQGYHSGDVGTHQEDGVAT